ncbi:uncharacterized protein LOC111079820 [Drosophila obscura]|uniref:uncharacterized protein LOC111079820 n=1 Tax=Drosophila obscura TaxID=7282 RepID=UPI000BA10A8C|nr:uncharacterized protein LOC111079820 [Drosophila obscura]
MEGKILKNKRLAEFSQECKLLLIKSVEKRPVIWDLANKKHFDSIATKNAWDSVAREINKDVTICKMAWKSLKDSYRYHIKSASRSKSGSAGGIQMQNPVANDGDEWMFAPHMAFLPDISAQRRTFAFDFLPKDESSSAGLDDAAVCGTSYLETQWAAGEKDLEKELDDLSSSTYSYERKAKKLSPPKNSSCASHVCDIFGKFVDQQVNPVLAYWDSMLNSLPLEDKAEVDEDITHYFIKKEEVIKKIC